MNISEKTRRHALSHKEQENEATSMCVPCRLCGARAEVTDAGPGLGYHINCSNAGYRGKCTQSGLRLSGWAYNVADRWNALNVKPTIAQIAHLYPEVRALVARRDDGAYRYLRHDGLCARIGGYGYCNCGLEAALAPFTEGGEG